MRFIKIKFQALLLTCCLLVSLPGQADLLGEAEQALTYGQYETALTLFTQLAEQGDPGAMIGLGRMYQGGHGVDKNEQTATSWYSKGVTIWNEQAKQNNPRAYASLGVLFDKGIAFKKDKSRARQYFKSAFNLAHPKALQGDNDSQHLIGMLYSSGKGTQQDIISGIQWLGKAADGGNETAAKMLIHIYECGCRGVAKDEEQLEYWRGKLAAISKSSG